MKRDDRAQDEVANAAPESRILVLAGPGTGKTETVAKRLAHLLKTRVRPGQVLVLSFSRSAVKTLTRRLERFISQAPEELEDLRHLAIRTFDSWCFRTLRLIGKTPGELLQGSYDANIARLVGEMRSDQRQRIAEVLRPLRHVIVDEFQDLSGVRGALVLDLLGLLAPAGKGGAGFTILGDEAQAIYGFAVRNLDETQFAELSARVLLDTLRKTYSGELRTVELGTNHRATEQLAAMTLALMRILARSISGEKKLDAMRKLVMKIPEIEGDLETSVAADGQGATSAVLTRTNGEVLRVAGKLSGNDASPPRVPVLVRTASQSRMVPAWIGATLGQVQGTAVTRTQFGKIYKHLFAEAKATEAAALGVPPEDIAWSRLVRATDAGPNAPAVDLAVLRERLGWTDLVPDDDSVSDRGIHVMTIHQSKGMEFSSVAIMEPVADAQEPPSDDDATEEASVIFVGVSRAGQALKRVPPRSTYTPLTRWKFQDGQRARWGMWRRGWINIEVGIDGDISQTSFVDTEVHGTAEAVALVQETLATKAILLRGQKVMLCKRLVSGTKNHFVYGIHLQKGSEPAMLLGTTTPQVTFDLLNRLHGAKYRYPLPQKIYNLRIADVVTMTFQDEPSRTISATWARSGLWLGVLLYGTGDFMTRSNAR